MSLPNIPWHTLGRGVGVFFDFASDLITVVLGGATVVAFFKYGKRISAALRLLKFQHLHDRKSEINQTLDLIAETPISKGRAIEVRSLFGRLNGQVLPVCELLPELKSLQVTIQSIAHENGRLNEPIKQQLVHQVKAVFEQMRYQALGDAAGDGDGR